MVIHWDQLGAGKWNQNGFIEEMAHAPFFGDPELFNHILTNIKQGLLTE